MVSADNSWPDVQPNQYGNVAMAEPTGVDIGFLAGSSAGRPIPYPAPHAHSLRSSKLALGVGSVAFSHGFKSCLVSDQQLLPTALDDSPAFPGAEQARHSVKCRAGQLSDILAAQWEVDVDTILLPTSRLFHKAQHRVGNTAFNFLGGHLAYTRVSFLKTLPNGAHGVDREMWVLLDDIAPNLIGPAHDHTFGSGDGCARVVITLQGLGKAEQVARMHDAHNYLLPFGRDLGDLEASVQEQIELAGLLPLFEYGFAYGDAAHVGASEQTIEFGIYHVREKRQAPNQTSIDIGHDTVSRLAIGWAYNKTPMDDTVPVSHPRLGLEPVDTKLLIGKEAQNQAFVPARAPH